MNKGRKYECTECGSQSASELSNYGYKESGLSNVVFRNVEVVACPACGNSDVIIPSMAKIHRALAQAIADSPARLTGEQFRFLRKYLGLSGDQLGSYLHTDKTKISKWERSEDAIGPATDRLTRLLVAALDSELRPGVTEVAEHLALIEDRPGNEYEIHLDAVTLQPTFLRVSRAA